MKRMASLLVLERLHHGLHALFEIAAVARAGEERAEIERPDGRLPEMFGSGLPHGSRERGLDDRGLADAGVSEEQRIVCDGAPGCGRCAELLGAADQRSMSPPAAAACDELGGVGLERVAFRTALFVVSGGQSTAAARGRPCGCRARRSLSRKALVMPRFLEEVNREASGPRKSLDQHGRAVQRVLAGVLTCIAARCSTRENASV
jgi:hypothetical protein